MTKSDDIASAVLSEFNRLPANQKPAVRSNGVCEWVPLCGIVADYDGRLKCLAMATGMKCLPAAKVPQANGVGIHDWHAEIIALRSFNRFVLQECCNVLMGTEPSDFIYARGDTGDGLPFAWRDTVHLHMYCSEAPCGDASMELTMAAQDNASPWIVPATSGTKAGEEMLTGRGYFSRLGMVRRKPGRGDSPPTLSKSCSDKLALRQCTSLLSGLSSLLVAPSPGLYLRSVVLPASQYSETGCERCFSAQGRMQPVANRSWSGGYSFTPFDVHATDLEFAFSRRQVNGLSHLTPASSNLSVVWTCHGIDECLVGGVLRGRKAFILAGASSVSRRRMWQLVQTITAAAAKGFADGQMPRQIHLLQQLFHDTTPTYNRVKASELLALRRCVKQEVGAAALRGWAPNDGDGNWTLDRTQ